MHLLSNGEFNQISNAVSNGVFDTINANTGAFGQVISKMVNARDMMANSGLFETINVDATTSNSFLHLILMRHVYLQVLFL